MTRTGPSFSSFAGGKLTMPEGLFKEALAALAQPPNSPANNNLDDRVYMAAALVEYRQRCVDAIRNNSLQHDVLICPKCRLWIQFNHMLDAFQCAGCQRGFTPAFLNHLFFNSATNPFDKGPPPATTWAPRLTTPAPKPIVADDYDGLDEKKTEQEEPIIMYRAWQLSYNDAEFLQSINKERWPHQAPMQARHVGSVCKADKSPAWNCNCGIYGVKTLRQAQRWATAHHEHLTQVLGRISCWGRVLMFETGAKAEFAYPLEIWLPKTWIEDAGHDPDEIKKSLAAKYAVDVKVEDGMFDLGLSHS